MDLAELKGIYDIAISLGAPCQPAEQLRQHGLRTFSGPFDWTVLEDVSSLIRAIDHKFENYFNLKNLVIKGKHDHTYLVFDEQYQCMSVHDFPHVKNDDPNLVFSAYPSFIEKMYRRIDRFYEKIQKSEKTLFVRYHASYEDTIALQQCLSNLTNNKFALIILNESHSENLIEEDWDVDNTYAAQINQGPQVSWQGYTPHWDYILDGISICDNHATIIDDPII